MNRFKQLGQKQPCKPWLGMAFFVFTAAAWAQTPTLESLLDCKEAHLVVESRLDGKMDNHQLVKYKQRVVDMCKKQLGEDHSTTLLAMHKLAISHTYLGQHAKALALHEQTLARRKAKLGEDHPDTLSSMNNLANSYGYLGQHAKAFALREQTLALRKAKLGEDHPDTLTSMSNLAISYSDLGQYAKALALKEQTVALMKAKLGEDHPDTLSSMNNLAVSYSDLGQYAKAQALHEQVLALKKAKLGKDHPDTLTSMNNLAASYSDLGQYAKAQALYEQTLALMKAKLGKDHPHTLTSMDNLAISYSNLGQHAKALALKEQTLALRKAKLGEDHPDTLSSMNSLAISYSDLGQHGKALALEEQTLALMKAKMGDVHPDTLTGMNNLAVSYSRLGQHGKALALYEQTLALMKAKLGGDHPVTLRSINNLAIGFLLHEQPAQAITLLPNYQRGVEMLRTQAGLSSEQKQSIFAEYSDHYQLWARVYARHDELTKGFDIGDQSKARTLADNIKTQSALRSLPAGEQAKLQEAEAGAKSAYVRLEALAGNGQTQPQALLQAQKDLQAANTAHAVLSKQLVATYPKYAQLQEIKATSVAEAPRLLSAGDAFVSYLVQQDGTAQVFVLKADGPILWKELGKFKNLAATVKSSRSLATQQFGLGDRLALLKDGGYQWLKKDETLPEGAEVIAKTADEALRTLNKYWHQALIAPLLPLVGDARRWIISPDKDLALLPFDTLPLALDEAGNTTEMLAQSHTSTLVQSFSVFALLKEREAQHAKLKRAKPMFAMGNAVYGPGWDTQQGMQRGRGQSAFRSADTDALRGVNDSARMMREGERYLMRDLRWQNLPGTAVEVEAAKSAFEAQGGADVLVGPKASEATLQSLNDTGKLKDYQYLLFSAHGYLAQNPELSALVLSQQDNPDGTDGYVTAAEWPLYDINSDLTVLSACDTGVGKTLAGEGVMGLPYALFIAGNRNTLLSLWPVDDDATAEFMRYFFTKLNEGLDQAQALAETKRYFQRSAEWRHPRFWAAFVLYGV